MITAFVRTVILYLLIILSLRLLGKRQIGELEPGELVLTMMLSDLASVPMQDFAVPLLWGIVPIFTLLSVSMLLSYGCLKSNRFRTMLCGKPAILIENGKLCQTTMAKNRITIDELLEQLRAQNIVDVTTVQHAILENSGQLSVLLWKAHQPPTAQEWGQAPQEVSRLPTVIISDGQVELTALFQYGFDLSWLSGQLRAKGFSSPKEVFLCVLSPNDTLLWVAKEGVIV
ncbi:DUF421 domain-containing protein [Bengtsoniella intestinalis]|uniref:YetF domain-containing protein n=1 Tax=Bengtsoniella intestinalis TaxID=3073143 RepID=UPI00391FC38F